MVCLYGRASIAERPQAELGKPRPANAMRLAD